MNDPYLEEKVSRELVKVVIVLVCALIGSQVGTWISYSISAGSH